MSARRKERLAEAYLKEISNILHFQTRDPCLEGAYITRVVFTEDLGLAKIYFDIAGGRSRENEVVQGFEHSKGFLRKELANRVKIKFVPDLKFYYDESSEIQARIDELFAQIERQKNEKGPKHQS